MVGIIGARRIHVYRRTIVADFEVESMSQFEAMMRGEGMSEELGKEFEKVMQGYHDLVEYGRREVFKIEGR